MQTKPVFEGRPDLDRVLRIVLAVSAVLLIVAAIVTRDLRAGAVGVFIIAFTLREAVVLDERQRQGTVVIMVASVAVWLVEAFG